MLLNPTEDLDEDVRANSILSKLDKAEAAESAKETPPAADKPVVEDKPESAPDKGADAAPAVERPSGTDSQPEPAPEPPIDAPLSWSKEKKEVFKTLPRDLQEYVAERERERDTETRRGQNEAAETRRQALAAQKAAEDKAAALAQEQQRYAQTLNALAQQMEIIDPVIGQYNKLRQAGELTKFAKDNPADYAALDAEYRSRMDRLNQIRMEQQTAQTAALNAHFEREERALVEKVPEWADSNVGPKAMSDIRSGVVQTYGYKPDEVRTINDHRLVLMARDALEAPKLRSEIASLKAQIAEKEKATAKAIQEKKVAPKVGTVVKPNPSEEQKKSASDRSAALLKQARGSKSISQKADIIAQMLGD